jgi:hypothetical protein
MHAIPYTDSKVRRREICGPKETINPSTLFPVFLSFSEALPMSEPVYQVVWPLGKSATQIESLNPRIDDLRGKTICELSHGGFRDQEIRPIVEETLAKKFPDIKFVDHTVFGNIHGPNEAEVLASLPENLKKNWCDAVISGIGS